MEQSSSECVVLADKNYNYDSSYVLKYLTQGEDITLVVVVSRLLSYTPSQLSMKPEEIDCKWHNTYLYRSKVEVQY